MKPDFDPTQPIWLQLVAEFSRRIVTGVWTPGERIGGVRELALEVGVNPNTVQRALAELERQGLCRAHRTTGRFVTDDADRIRALRRDLAATATDDFIRGLRGHGFTRDEATALLHDRWDQHDHPASDSQPGDATGGNSHGH
ncbi:GntR family transcriptional regulator [Parenemella sanctibonifatiensis]|uniref:GntR family transcriptional regulator n=1 Tax=Parenemella sanctibonifatiensis TaxID=2016505 RepID=A0A255E8P5_9ACTN|nr:GntR family transcriptional regulator [Parenemella sanctibonifatiensis]OYN87938.1 GntR family transcriptional regulator [Parenemella sanctibonifatiensis]OYN92241.1 GntR family transcriptional regulator [Parenemella sanctibonifatiensis]